MAEQTFEVGQKVKVISEYDTNRTGEIGNVHIVLGGDDFDYEVKFDDGEIELFFDDELTLVTPPEAPRGGTAAADDASITRTEVAYALINTLYQDMKQNPDDGKKALAYFRELADARLSDVYDLMDERSELRAQLAAARERERAAQSKYLELVAMISYYTEDNKGVPYCRDIRGEVAKAAADALQAAQAQQPGRADGYAVGQEVILLDGTSLIGQVIEKGYKVSLDGSEGRWYTTDELAAYNAGKAQDTASD